jgi:hypothetical protein
VTPMPSRALSRDFWTEKLFRPKAKILEKVQRFASFFYSPTQRKVVFCIGVVQSELAR